MWKWEVVALVSAVVGLLSLVPYWLAAHTDPGAQMNLACTYSGSVVSSCCWSPGSSTGSTGTSWAP